MISDRLQPVARELFEAWSRLPRVDGVPMRASFDPISVVRILPVVSIFQRIGADDWRLRLIGTEIERRWGRSLTGLSYLDMMSAQAAAVTHCEFEMVRRQPCGSWSHRQVALTSGRRVQTETLRLPLRAADGAITLILGSNAELNPGSSRALDPSREVLTVLDQEFFDIGAGLPDVRCIPEPAAA
jgi:hypothetical protein